MNYGLYLVWLDERDRQLGAPRRNRRRLRPASKTPVSTRQTGLFES
jgi:hypothetical protein